MIIMVEQRYIVLNEEFEKKEEVNFQPKFIFNVSESLVNILKKIKLENNVKYLREELKYFLQDDPDFKIKRIMENEILIGCLNKEAFCDSKIMEKIFGKIIFSDCILNLEKRTIRAKDPSDDKKIFNFKLFLDKGINYRGSIIIEK